MAVVQPIADDVTIGAPFSFMDKHTYRLIV